MYQSFPGRRLGISYGGPQTSLEASLAAVSDAIRSSRSPLRSAGAQSKWVIGERRVEWLSRLPGGRSGQTSIATPVEVEAKRAERVFHQDVGVSRELLLEATPERAHSKPEECTARP